MRTFTRNDIDTVWLDLDDTLWDFHNNSLISLASLYETEHLDLYFDTVEQWQERYLTVNHSLWPLYNNGSITKEFLMTERFRRPLDEASFPQDKLAKTVARLDVEYLKRLGQLPHLIPGALQLLHYLRDKGYQIGIISNGFHEVQSNKLRSSGIEHFIDVMVLSDDIGINKPDRRIFDHAIIKANTSAQRSIIIGDNPDTDISGAINAGWHAIYFNRDNANPTQPPQDALMITHLNQVRDIIL